jgi:hypothetical protein
MTRIKTKIERPSASEEKKGKRVVFTVNIARMDRFLVENQNIFRERAKLVAPHHGEFVGALAGPTAKRRAAKA